MTLSAYARLLRRRWRVAGLVLALCTLGAVVVGLLLPQTYVARTTSFVSISGSAGSAPDQLYQNSQYALNQVQSYPLIVSSPEVLQPVIDELGLDLGLRELEDRVTATNPVNTVLLEITATSDSPREAQAIANSVSDNLARLVETLEGTPGAETVDGVDVSPVQVTTPIPATLPTSPASPGLPVLGALGVLLGLALGAIAAVLRERSDTRLSARGDVEAVTGEPLLAAVHRDPRARRDPLALTKAASPAVEDLRGLRTALRTTLRHGDGEARAQRVVVASGGPGEGTSLLASNLAVVMTQARLRVCLVVADLREGRSPFYAGIEEQPGLGEVITGTAELSDVLVSWDGDSLYVLPPGTAPHARDLLDSPATTAVLEKLGTDFDLLVIEAPPLLEVGDGAVLAAASDGIVVVVRHGHTRRDALRTTLGRLRGRDVEVLGTVLCDMPHGRT